MAEIVGTPSSPTKSKYASNDGIGEEDWAVIQARHRRGLAARAVLAGVLLCVASWLVFSKGVRPTRAELDAKALLQPYRAQPFRPPYPLNPAVVAQIDMGKVHAELIPAWVVSLQHSPHTLGYSRAHAAFSTLRDEVGQDPNLAALVDQLHEKLMDGAYEYGGEIRELIRGWNEYMVRAGIAFRLEYHLERTIHGPELRIRSYRLLADVAVNVQREPYRVLLLSREDRTNLVEAFFGHTSLDRETALVMTDRIVDFGVEKLWPLLAVDAGSVMDVHSSLLSLVRAEGQSALGVDVAVLQEGWSLHQELEGALAALRERRGCGTTVVIDHVAWDGLSERALEMVEGVARKNETRHCGRLTKYDADRVGKMSRRLHEQPELELALGRVAAWLAKAVAVHEARHLADDRTALDQGVPLCKACPGSLGRAEQAEISAYLASFSVDGLGYVSLFQACGVDLERQEPHAAALRFILPKLLAGGCQRAVPEDLYARARTLAAELFGRYEPVELPQAFPQALPVPRG